MISHAQTDARPSRTSALPTLLTGVSLLGVAMAGTAVLAPGLAWRASGLDHPDYLSIAGVGLVMIALSSVLLAFASRVLGLGAAWLGLALLSNGLILVGKFVLVPLAFYKTTFVAGDPFIDVRSPAFFPALAAGVGVVQVGMLAILGAWSRGRVTLALGTPSIASRHPDLTGALLAAGLVLGGIVLATVVVLSGLSLFGYAVVTATATGGAAAVVVLLAMGAGSGALHAAAGRSISVRDTAIVTSVFWLALAMLLVYHVVWVIFMTVLVSLWPLKVVAPSGK